VTVETIVPTQSEETDEDFFTHPTARDAVLATMDQQANNSEPLELYYANLDSPDF
jgi:hypothetical protein